MAASDSASQLLHRTRMGSVSVRNSASSAIVPAQLILKAVSNSFGSVPDKGPILTLMRTTFIAL